jgi:hypothetical protein
MEPYHQRLMTAGAAAGIGYKRQSDRAEINWFSGISRHGTAVYFAFVPIRQAMSMKIKAIITLVTAFAVWSCTKKDNGPDDGKGGSYGHLAKHLLYIQHLRLYEP